MLKALEMQSRFAGLARLGWYILSKKLADELYDKVIQFMTL